MSQRVRLSAFAREVVAQLSGERLVRAAVRDRYNEVWAVGKAAAAMARGSGVSAGIVITKKAEVIDGLEVHEAGHPFPDERGVKATLRLLERARAASGRVLVSHSGGASEL